jgi:hypothetical protein
VSGWLKNANPTGNLTRAARCGAKTRCSTACQSPAMKNGRCRMHGGKSTGPKTPAGLERSRQANWKHGHYSATAKAERYLFRQLLRESRNFLADILLVPESIDMPAHASVILPLCRGFIAQFCIPSHYEGVRLCRVSGVCYKAECGFAALAGELTGLRGYWPFPRRGSQSDSVVLKTFTASCC